MREVILDTETTGLDPATGDRVVEIACLELVDGLPTEHIFQTYCNPERHMPRKAYNVHGISSQLLETQPKFSEIMGLFLTFIGDDRLVAHNASFDLKFINAELVRAQRERDVIHQSRAIDTVALAKARYPGCKASLDALCKRFKIRADRRVHGALLDCELLARVYLELRGGRQEAMEFLAGPNVEKPDWLYGMPRPAREHPPITEGEVRAHEAFVEGLTDPIWSR